MRYSDDGEPSGTAGMPVLDMLKKEGLTNTVVVVTRYFGGILLGTGGLVHTYSKSAKAGVLAANILEMILCRELSVICVTICRERFRMNCTAGNSYRVNTIFRQRRAFIICSDK